MKSFLRDRTYLFIVCACLVGLLLIVLIAICFHLHLKHRRKANNSFYDYIPSLDSLEFTYDTNIETQQSSISKAGGPLQDRIASEEEEEDSLTSHDHSDLDAGDEDDDRQHLLKNNIDFIQPFTSPLASSLTSTSGESNECIDAVTIPPSDDLGRFASLPNNALGRISSALFYDKTLETLRVNVIQWYNSGTKTNKSTLSPYVKVRLFPHTARQFLTKTKRAENPVFDEEFSFAVVESEVKEMSVEFSVCDFDRFSRQNVLGSAVVKLGEVMDRLALPDGTGELWANLTESNELSSNYKGDILLSLSYFPTANRITLTVAKAKKLNVEESDTGVSIKVNLLFGGKLAKTRKTSVRDVNISDPVYDKSWGFDVPSNVLDQASLVVCVYAYSHNKKRIIGKVSTGSLINSPNSGLTQWNEMLSQPRSAISYWHKLI